MRKVLSVLLVVIMAFSFATFALASEGPNELVISYGPRPNLDIHWNAGMDGAFIMGMMYEGLYRYTETGFELAGATSCDVSEDGMIWTYHLRDNAVWNDGKPVTANDYVYSLQRLVDPDVESIYMTDYGQFIKNGLAISNREMSIDELGVKALDDYTLEVQLEELCTYFDAVMCYTTYFPLREDAVQGAKDKTGDWAWNVDRSITNGPLNMTFCNEEEEIILEKNPTYWNADNIGIDKITIKLLEDDNTRLGLFKTGNADMIFSVPSEEVISLMDEGYMHYKPRLITSFLLVNCEKEPFNDPRIRTALSLSIDREYLSDVLFNGNRTPAVSYIGPGFPGSEVGKDFRAEAGDLFAMDTEKARELLAEAGFPGGEGFPVLDCSFGSSGNNTILFEYLQAVWEEELGITVKLSPMEGAAMTELRDAGKFDITPQGWGPDYIDASNMLSIFTTGNFINGGRYSSEKYDELFNQSLKTVDLTERIGLLHEAEKTLIDDMGIIPLYHGNTMLVYDDNVVSNVRVAANGCVIFTDIVVTK